MSKKDKRLYNYLVNTLGLSKEMALTYSKERMDELLDKHIASKLESNHFQDLVLNKITNLVNGNVSESWYTRQTFEDFFKKAVDKVIMDKFNNEYTLEVKVIRKDQKTIAQR